MKRLKIKTECGSEYVFCRVTEGYNVGRLITTRDKNKALPAEAINYFRQHFSEKVFFVE